MSWKLEAPSSKMQRTSFECCGTQVHKTELQNLVCEHHWNAFFHKPQGSAQTLKKIMKQNVGKVSSLEKN